MFKGKIITNFSQSSDHDPRYASYSRVDASNLEKAVCTRLILLIDFGKWITGILAIKAAKCGAGKVIAIERNPDKMPKLFQKTNAQTRITLILKCLYLGNAKQFA